MSGPRVVVVDEDELRRSVVIRALERDAEATVVGEAADGERCVEVVRATQPNAVVLDQGIEGIGGASLTAEIRRAAPEVRVVVRSTLVDLVELVRVVAGLASTGTRPSEASVTLPVAARSPADARRWVAERCAAWGCGAEVDAAQLIVSELVTNAVVHAASPCELRLRLSAGVLRIQVHDRSTASPALAPRDVDAEGGRGLLLIDAVSDAWGVELLPDGKCVWAEIVRRRAP